MLANAGTKSPWPRTDHARHVMTLGTIDHHASTTRRERSRSTYCYSSTCRSIARIMMDGLVELEPRTYMYIARLRCIPGTRKFALKTDPGCLLAAELTVDYVDHAPKINEKPWSETRITARAPGRQDGERSYVELRASRIFLRRTIRTACRSGTRKN